MNACECVSAARSSSLRPHAPGPAGDHTGDVGWRRAESRRGAGAGGAGVAAHAQPGHGLEPLPAPSPGSPHAPRTGRRPHSPRPFVAHGPRRPQGGPRRQRPGWKIPGRQEGRGPAGSRLLLRLLRAPGRRPRPVPPSRTAPAAQRPPRPGRGAGELESRAAELGGRAWARVRVCARRRASRWAGPGRVRALRSALGVHKDAVRLVCVCVRVCVREGARWGGYTCACVHARVRVRVHRCVLYRLGVRLPGWSGVHVFVRCACVQARSPAHAGGGGGLCVCGSVDADGVPATPGPSSGRSPWWGSVGNFGCQLWPSPYAPPYPHPTSPPFWRDYNPTGTGRRGGGGQRRQCQRWGTDEGGRGTGGEQG